MNTDADLLKQFASSGDESAFREIVERHAPMVHGVAWRRTQDRALAEEITQTVFTIFARKAGSLHHSELAGWLHRTAFMESRNTTRKESRRREAHQQFTAHMNVEPAASAAWQDISPHLDEAMSRLSPEERRFVIMRYFEQRSYHDIAATTGKTEEASRKQVQRSLDRLGALLRRRGIVTTGAALGVVIAGQSLCVPPVSASVIATGALQAAPALASSTVLTYTFTTMTAATVIKSSIATLALAALPLAWLWQQNSNLQQEVRHLKAEVLAQAPPPASAPARQKLAAAAAGENAADAPAVSVAAASPQKGEPGFADALSGLFAGGDMAKLAASELKRDSVREFNRLSQRLKLTPAQKEKLQKFYDERHEKLSSTLAAAMQSGLLAKAMKGGSDLTEEETATLASMDSADDSAPELDKFLPGLLTPEQQAEYAAVKEEKRKTDAEDAAQAMLSTVSKHVDLSEDQKDRVFQALAQKKLADPAPGAEGTGTGNNPKAASAAGIDVTTSFPEYDQSNDDILRGILTPEQFTTYDEARAAEEQHTRELLKMVMPWAPQKEGAEAGK